MVSGILSFMLGVIVAIGGFMVGYIFIGPALVHLLRGKK